MNEFDELESKPFAIKYLADNLTQGTLVLFIGAGTSKGFGLPNWLELVNNLRTEVKLPELAVGSSADELQNAADEVANAVKDDKEFVELVQRHLYPKADALTVLDVLNNQLLVSISALLMGSKRGRVTRVVTLNYDSMLEWFLSLFGFVVKTVYQLPDLEGSEDIRIYHPHGFIPHPLFNAPKSDFVLLGMDKVNERLGTLGDPWFEMTRHILDTGLCLFIGMSGNTLSDRALAPLFKTSGNKVAGKRPLGIWLLKGTLTDSKKFEFYRNNIVPISILEEKEICEFLLQICQAAIEKFKK